MARPTKEQLAQQVAELTARHEELVKRLTKSRNNEARLRNILAQLVHHQDAEELEDVDEEDRAGFVPNASPGHRHTIPGHWDIDDSVCKQCESWAAARKILKEG